MSNEQILIDQLKRRIAELENQLEDIKCAPIIAYQNSRNGFIAKENRNPEYSVALICKP